MAVFLLAAPPARAGEAAPPADAATLYNDGQYLQAARAFESQWRKSGDAGILYNAGLAREAAGPGNDALALIHWQRFLETADNVTDAERADLAKRSEAARGRMASLELAYEGPPGEHPGSALLSREGADERDRLELQWPADRATLLVYVDPGEWTVQFRGQETPPQLRVTARSASDDPIRLVVSGTQARADAHPENLPQALPHSPVELTLGPKRALKRGVELTWEPPTPTDDTPAPVDTHEPSHAWTLAPGPWTLRASADGFETETTLVNVLNRPVGVELKLQRTPMEKARIGLGVGMGIASVGLLAGGVGIFRPRAASDSIGVYASPGSEEGSSEEDDQLKAVHQQVTLRTSLSLLGAGLGLGIPAATAGLRGKTRAYAVEAALGGVFAVTGATLFMLSYKCDEGWDEPTTLTKCHAHGVSGGAALGLGAGLLGGASLSLLTHSILKKRRQPKRTTRRSPQLGANGHRHGASLSLSGRF